MRRWLCWLLALVLVLGASGETEAAGKTEEPGPVVAGYYPSWAAGQGWPPERLKTEGLTRVNYAFAAIEEGHVAVTEADKERLRALKALGGLEVVLSVGGWDGSGGFSDAAATASSRARFAQSCLDLILELGLDGVDLDWEYPVSGGAAGTPHRPQDRRNFTLLLQTLRQSLDRQSRRDGRDYLLSIAGGAGAGYLRCIEPQAVASLVDQVFLMAYDFHGPWSPRTGHNAPLNGVEAAVDAWLAQGVPAEKLVLGIPLYGYIFQGTSGLNGGFSSAKSASYDTLLRDYAPRLRQSRDEGESVPCLAGADVFITYDDPVSAAGKGALARRKGLGGIGFWELSQDRTGALVQAAEGAFRTGRASGFTDVPPGAWYEEAVGQVSALGLMQGVAPGRFAPEATVTRGQIAAMLHRAAGAPDAGARNPFSDVAPESYCAGAAAWASEQGVLLGYAGGTFRPGQPVTRQQLAAAFFRYAGLRGWDTGRRASLRGFADQDRVASYAREPLRWALAAGVLQGRAGGLLDPEGPATRAQTAVMLCRLLALDGTGSP